MTKADFVANAAQVAGTSKAAMEGSLAAAFQVLADALIAGDSLGWPGFGTFKVVDRAARTGMNPQTGKAMAIAAKKAVKFSAATGLKDTLNR